MSADATPQDIGAMWDRFIERLDAQDGITHKNLLGGISSYRKKFVAANSCAPLAPTQRRLPAPGHGAPALTRAQINSLARQAGLPMSWLDDGKASAWPELERFAALVGAYLTLEQECPHGVEDGACKECYSAATTEDALRPPDQPQCEPRPPIQEERAWYCPECRKEVPESDLLFTAQHSGAKGGCGLRVVPQTANTQGTM